MNSSESDRILYQIMNKASEYVNENFSDGDNEHCKNKNAVIFIGLTTLLVLQDVFKSDDVEKWYEDYVKKDYSDNIDKCVNSILVYKQMTNELYNGFKILEKSELLFEGIDALFVGLEVMKNISPDNYPNKNNDNSLEGDLTLLFNIITDKIVVSPTFINGMFSVAAFLKDFVESFFAENNNSKSIENDYTLYDVLEVSEKASEEVIKMAYKALCKKYHPDIYKGDPDYANQKMYEINEAYSILSNQSKRAEYDKKLFNSRKNAEKDTQHRDTDTPKNNTSAETEKQQEFKDREKIEKHTNKTVIFVVLFIIIGLILFIIIGTSYKPSNEFPNESDIYAGNETNFIDSGELGEATDWDEFGQEAELFFEMVDLYGYDYDEIVSDLEEKGYNVETGRPLIQSFILEYFGGQSYPDLIGMYDSYRNCYIETFADYERMTLDLMKFFYEKDGIDALRSMQHS